MESLGRRELALGGVALSLYLCYRALVSLLQCARQVPGSVGWWRRAFPRPRPFAGLGTSLCVSLKQRNQHHPAPGQAGRRCTPKTVSCAGGDSLYPTFGIQSFRLSGSVFSLPMTSSPLSPFIRLFLVSASLRLVCLPGFVLLPSFIKSLFSSSVFFPFLPTWS